MPQKFIHSYIDNLRQLVDKPHKNAVQHHAQILRLAAKQRLEILKAFIQKQHGLTLSIGAFKGMKFLPRISEGCYIPKLLGCYEAELHDTWQNLVATRHYTNIIDIGAAEGYYVVGLARLFPQAHLLAYDTYVSDHALIDELARLNNVRGRVIIRELFTHKDFTQFMGQPTLLVCDIEGAEKELLDPEKAAALNNIDIVVELHNVFDPSIQPILLKRFSATHDIEIIHEQLPRQIELPEFMVKMDRLDIQLALWEYRVGSTPWAVMRAKKLGAD